MSASAEQIARVRRMAAESAAGSGYTDAMLATFIESHTLLDEDGRSPEDTLWTATYDLNAAAADVWEEKAGGQVDNFDFHADGGVYSRSQVYEMYMKQARYFRSRRSAKTISMTAFYESAEDVTLVGSE